MVSQRSEFDITPQHISEHLGLGRCLTSLENVAGGLERKNSFRMHFARF